MKSLNIGSKKTTIREKEDREAKDREEKSERVKVDNQISQSNSSQVKCQRSEVTYHKKVYFINVLLQSVSSLMIKFPQMRFWKSVFCGVKGQNYLSGTSPKLESTPQSRWWLCPHSPSSLFLEQAVVVKVKRNWNHNAKVCQNVHRRKLWQGCGQAGGACCKSLVNWQWLGHQARFRYRWRGAEGNQVDP